MLYVFMRVKNVFGNVRVYDVKVVSLFVFVLFYCKLIFMSFRIVFKFFIFFNTSAGKFLYIELLVVISLGFFM